jgi:hypothetical protein
MPPSPIKSHSAQIQAQTKGKLFIIGLPRTGTTSVCVALLEQGLKVAHQGFTQQSFYHADAIADAPVFSDFKQLDGLFPGAKFVYLSRDIAPWIISMQMLLSRMLIHLDEHTGRFHPIMKRSFNHSFKLNLVTNPFDEVHLKQCYLEHQQAVEEYFTGRNDLLKININQVGSLSRLLEFIELAPQEGTPGIKSAPLNFPHLNIGRNVASWDEYKHPNKVSANLSGPNKRKFFDYTLS